MLEHTGFRWIAVGLLGTVMTTCSPTATHPKALRIRWTKDVATLDPLVARSTQERELLNLMHASLLAVDTKTLRMAPMLAEALPRIVSQDSISRVTYTLRPEATWENGQPILASDVAYTLKVMHCPGLPNEIARLNYGAVRAIEMDSTTPRRFTLLCARSSTEELLVLSGDFAVLPEYSLDPRHTLRSVPLPLLQQQPAAALRQFPALRAFADRYRRASYAQQPTSGPYHITAWKPNQYVALQRKGNWWGAKIVSPPPWLQACPAQIRYVVIPDPAVAMVALRRGTVDVYPMPPVRAFLQQRQRADSAHFRYRTVPSYNLVIAGYNTEKPVLRDGRTRQALSRLFNVPGIIQATQPTLAYRSVGLINPTDRVNYHDSLSLVPFSPPAAFQALRTAGWQPQADNSLWRQGRQLTVSITYLANNVELETAALQFKEAARTIGIPVTLLPTAGALLEANMRTGDLDMYITTFSGSPLSYNLQPVLHSEGISAYNTSRFSNPEMDKLVTQIATEPDEKRRARQLRRMQALMQRESPLVVLYFTRNRLIAGHRVAHMEATSIRPGYEAMNVKLATE